MRHARALTAATLAALVTAGCGSPAPASRLGSGAAQSLHLRLADVAAAATARDGARARTALDGFARLVDQDAAAGVLAPGDAAAIRRGIAHARQRIMVELPVPPQQAVTAPAAPQPGAAPQVTTPAAPQPEAAPQAPAPNPDSGKGKGHGDGNGKGSGGD